MSVACCSKRFRCVSDKFTAALTHLLQLCFGWSPVLTTLTFALTLSSTASLSVVVLFMSSFTNHLGLTHLLLLLLLFFTPCGQQPPSLPPPSSPPTLQLPEDLLTWTNPPTTALLLPPVTTPMPRRTRVVISPQIVAPRSPNGAETPDRTQLPPTVALDTLTTTQGRREGAAGTQIPTQSTYCPLEAGMVTGYLITNRLMLAGAGPTEERTETEM